jgi:hypothetical protein
MHLIQFREIMRDAEVAYAIHPIVRKYLLSVNDTTQALIACGVPRAANVARITNAWDDMTADSLTARKSVVKARAPRLSKPQSHVDNLVSKNN